MAHDHLTFLQHGERNFSSGGVGVGGVQIPTLTMKTVTGGNYSNSNNDNEIKPFAEKLIDVVDFLQSLPPGQKVHIPLPIYYDTHTLSYCLCPTYTLCLSLCLSHTLSLRQAGIDDIYLNCLVDLEGSDYAVLDSLKNNPKVEIEDTDENIYFKYRAKYEIRSESDLTCLHSPPSATFLP